jgi:hypothetical protein
MMLEVHYVILHEELERHGLTVRVVQQSTAPHLPPQSAWPPSLIDGLAPYLPLSNT